MKEGISTKKMAYIPEALLLIGGIFCLGGELIYGSPISMFSGMLAVGILAVLALLIWKNKHLALTISIILGCVGLFFVLAMLYEFKKFPSGSLEGLQLLAVGSLIFGGLIGISIQMPKKYFNFK